MLTKEKKQKSVTKDKMILVLIIASALCSAGVIAYLAVRKSATYDVTITTAGVMNIKLSDWSYTELLKPYDGVGETILFADDYKDVSPNIDIRTVESIPNERVVVLFRLKGDCNSPNIYLQANVQLDNTVTITSITGYLAVARVNNPSVVIYDSEPGQVGIDYTPVTIPFGDPGTSGTKTLIDTDVQFKPLWSREESPDADPVMGELTITTRIGFYLVVVEIDPNTGNGGYNPDPGTEEPGSTITGILSIEFEFRDA